MKVRLYFFLMGIFFYNGVLMAWQDFIGKEKYIEYVHAHWMNLHPIIGLFFAFLAVRPLVSFWDYWYHHKD